jgi:hypothetical protein
MAVLDSVRRTTNDDPKRRYLVEFPGDSRKRRAAIVQG